MKFKKIIFGLLPIGILTAIITPTFVVSSCGNSFFRDKQELLDNITSEKIKSILNIKTDVNKLPSKIPKPLDMRAKINGLDDVTIKIITWVPNDENGSITVTVLLSKVGLVSPPELRIIYYHFESSSINKQHLMNHITNDMVKTALKIKESANTFPSDVKKPGIHAITINGLKNVIVHIIKWAPDDDKGIITMTVALTKNGLATPPFFKIKFVNFLTNNQYDQQLMNGITVDMVRSKIIPSTNYRVLPSQIHYKKSEKVMIINGLSNVVMEISSWKANDQQGSITATVSVSKTGLKPPKPFKIKWTGFQKQQQYEQALFSVIKANDVKKALGITAKKAFASAIKNPVNKKVTLNNVKDVNIHIFNWVPNDEKGTLTVTVVLLKPGLTSPPPFKFVITGYETNVATININKGSGKMGPYPGTLSSNVHFFHESCPLKYMNINYDDYSGLVVNSTILLSKWGSKSTSFIKQSSLYFTNEEIRTFHYAQGRTFKDLVNANPDDNKYDKIENFSGYAHQLADFKIVVQYTKDNNGVLGVYLYIRVGVLSQYATTDVWGDYTLDNIQFVKYH